MVGTLFSPVPNNVCPINGIYVLFYFILFQKCLVLALKIHLLHALQTSSQISVFHFHSFNDTFWWGILIFLWSFILLIFCFEVIAFYVLFLKIAHLGAMKIFPFASKIFIILPFTFQYMIYLMLISVYNVK